MSSWQAICYWPKKPRTCASIRTCCARAYSALLEDRAPGRYWVAERGGQVVGQLLITYEWSDWRNRLVWWIQSVHVAPAARRHGVFRVLYAFARQEAQSAGAGGLRLYVDVTNTRAQAVYTAMGMNGDHYRVFEEMFEEPARVGS